MPGSTTYDRIIVAAVSFLIAAFALAAMSALVAPAMADETAGVRDDDSFELVAKGEDDDDDDTGTGTGTNGGAGAADSNSNSKTGTTRGTGKSNSKSNTS